MSSSDADESQYRVRGAGRCGGVSTLRALGVSNGIYISSSEDSGTWGLNGGGGGLYGPVLGQGGYLLP